MKKLGLLDLGMLLSESRESPKHIGVVALFRIPDGEDEQAFLRGFADALRNVDDFLSPFGDRLKTGRLGLAGPAYWEPDSSIDIDYHIRHSALPKPGRYRELFTLISRLHGTLLDRSRPLWEIHLIEGLENRQFALYQKIHHAMMDGGRGQHLVRSMMSADPDNRFNESPLSKISWERYRDQQKKSSAPKLSDTGLGDKEARTVANVLSDSLETGVSYFNILKKFGRAWVDSSDPLSLPFKKVPASSINTDIDGARRFVAQTWPFDRIRKVGKAYDATFNDAVLGMCAGAIRRYLLEYASLPNESLKAMVPVSVRQKGDLETTNALAMISADLATNISDPVDRIARIKASTQAGKDFYSELSPSETMLLSTAMQAPGMVLGPMGLASRIPAFNTIISNVAGVREPMYWNGARLDGMYPVSMLADGVALNITVHTYDQNVDFGIVACRRSLPRIQRMIDYMEESLAELEQAAGLPPFEAPEAPVLKRAVKLADKPEKKLKRKRKIKAKIQADAASSLE